MASEDMKIVEDAGVADGNLGRLGLALEAALGGASGEDIAKDLKYPAALVIDRLALLESGRANWPVLDLMSGTGPFARGKALDMCAVTYDGMREMRRSSLHPLQMSDIADGGVGIASLPGSTAEVRAHCVCSRCKSTTVVHTTVGQLMQFPVACERCLEQHNRNLPQDKKLGEKSSIASLAPFATRFAEVEPFEIPRASFGERALEQARQLADLEVEVTIPGIWVAVQGYLHCEPVRDSGGCAVRSSLLALAHKRNLERLAEDPEAEPVHWVDISEFAKTYSLLYEDGLKWVAGRPLYKLEQLGGRWVETRVRGSKQLRPLPPDLKIAKIVLILGQAAGMLNATAARREAERLYAAGIDFDPFCLLESSQAVPTPEPPPEPVQPPKPKAKSFGFSWDDLGL